MFCVTATAKSAQGALRTSKARRWGMLLHCWDSSSSPQQWDSGWWHQQNCLCSSGIINCVMEVKCVRRGGMWRSWLFEAEQQTPMTGRGNLSQIWFSNSNNEKMWSCILWVAVSPSYSKDWPDTSPTVLGHSHFLAFCPPWISWKAYFLFCAAPRLGKKMQSSFLIASLFYWKPWGVSRHVCHDPHAVVTPLRWPLTPQGLYFLWHGVVSF